MAFFYSDLKHFLKAKFSSENPLIIIKKFPVALYMDFIYDTENKANKKHLVSIEIYGG